MQYLHQIIKTTEKKLKRELTPQEEKFLKWLHEAHLKEINQRELKR